MYTLRPYQSSAVNAAIMAIGKRLKNGMLVLPTGSGKSLVVASIASNIPGDTLVLQPSVEILQQNYEKMVGFGVDMSEIGIFSASAGSKKIRRITLATIGSIIRDKQSFAHFSQIIIDECHAVNSDGGMYQELIEYMNVPVIGLTATPYRMHSGQAFRNGPLQVECKMLHRTRPRIFEEILHITQVQEMYENGFLCPLQYDIFEGYNRDNIKLNSTGLDFNDQSLSDYNEQVDLVSIVKRKIAQHNARHTLVFTKFMIEAQELSQALAKAKISAAFISGETPKKERKKILCDFKSGKIRVVANVGVLTTGFDFPALDCVILARPTMSLPLYYQMVGRGIRTSEGKTHCTLVDLCGNVGKFGEVEYFWIDTTKKGLERMHGRDGPLSGVNFVTMEDLEQKRREYFAKKAKAEATSGSDPLCPIGKYKGQKMSTVPKGYVSWAAQNITGGVREFFIAEAKRRGIM